MNELTAEQVRKAIFNGSSYASYDGAKYYADGIGMQAIADELNALAERTCKLKFATERMSCTDRWCSECDADLSDVPIEYTNYCPNCGRKVVGE